MENNQTHVQSKRCDSYVFDEGHVLVELVVSNDDIVKDLCEKMNEELNMFGKVDWIIHNHGVIFVLFVGDYDKVKDSFERNVSWFNAKIGRDINWFVKPRGFIHYKE